MVVKIQIHLFLCIHAHGLDTGGSINVTACVCILCILVLICGCYLCFCVEYLHAVMESGTGEPKYRIRRKEKVELQEKKFIPEMCNVVKNLTTLSKAR